MILKDVGGDFIDVDFRDDYIEIIIDDSSGCAPIYREEAIKLANAILSYYGVSGDS